MKISKKFVIGISVFLFLIILLGVIKLLNKTEEEKWESLNVPKYENIDSYKIKKEENETLIINENARLELKIPAEWKITKETKGDDQTQEIRISSPDLEKEDSIFPYSGCEIGLFIKINSSSFSGESDEEEIINERLFFKKTFHENSEKGSFVSFKTSANNREYNFILLASEKDKDRCLQEFRKVLESILIE